MGISEKAINGRVIWAARDRQNLTQTELLLVTGIGQNDIARAEADDGPIPRLDAIGRILAEAGYELQLRTIKKVRYWKSTPKKRRAYVEAYYCCFPSCSTLDPGSHSVGCG